MSAVEDIDVDLLRSRYQEERQKRLDAKAGGAKYYLTQGELERYGEDPWAAELNPRDPIEREVEALVVGGGFAGLVTAARLRDSGIAISDICIVERGADFGGTWYWNRYPGLCCDTEAYIYLPLLEETGYIPTEKYAKGPEIFEHARRIGRHFGLYEGALFQTQIRDAEWDEAARRWIMRTDRGDTLRARNIFLCSAGANRPKLPGVPGIIDFKGHSFHTMRWDYGYTGGNAAGNLVDLKDKRVGLIGTGATAVQAVPPLGEWSKELYVFQRTPSSVNVRNNRATDAAWAAELEPGWQLRRMENFLSIVSGIPQEEDLVSDAWTWNFRHVMRVFEEDLDRKLPKDLQELADFRRMEEIRNRVDSIVSDKATADALKPWYGLLCKRPTFHDSYLQTFNRPNVSLVDTNGVGVERITEKGIVANGREYELDCIVFATGFDTSSPRVESLGFNPVGAGGLKLGDRLAKDPSTLHGIHVSGFPNMFIIGGSQSTLATTFTYTLDIQARHCAKILAHCRERGIERVEVKPEAESGWQRELVDKAVDHREYFHDCTPGYYNLEGGQYYVWQFYYGRGPVAYRQVLDQWWQDEHVEQDLRFEAA